MSLQLPSEAGYTPEKFMVLSIYFFIFHVMRLVHFQWIVCLSHHWKRNTLDPQEERSPIFCLHHHTHPEGTPAAPDKLILTVGETLRPLLVGLYLVLGLM